jgi:hypothetical protein
MTSHALPPIRWFVLAPVLSASLVSVSALSGPTDGVSATAASALPSVTASATSQPKPSDAESATRHTALVASVTLKVINPTETRQRVQQKALERGGFAVIVTDRELSLKLPPQALSALLEEVADSGLVIEKSLERQDLTLEVAKLEAQLKSKQAILTELRDFFDGSDVGATLRVEKSMMEIVDELEHVKGSLRVLYERASWSVVHVHFQFKERRRLTDIESPFEWLNSVKLERFLEEF